MNKLFQLWKKIIRSGTHEKMDFVIQERVILSNQLGVINILVGIALIFVFSQRQNSNLTPLWLMIGIGLAIPAINRMGLHLGVRFLLSVLPCLTVLSYDISAKLANPQAVKIINYISPQFVITASIALPLTLFVWKEKIFLLLSTLVVLFTAIFFQEFYRFFGIHPIQLQIDLTGYQFVPVNFYIVLVILLSTFIFIIKSTNQNSLLNRKVLEESLQKNEQLNQNEQQLKITLEQLEFTRQEESKRTWVSKGLADFGLLLRSQLPIWKIYNQFLSNLIRYLNVQQGGVYILNQADPEQPFMELVTSFAYSAEKNEQREILIGEGLVGQAFLSKKIIYLQEPPEGYLPLESGLGIALPPHILIIPLLINNESIGVIEIASFYPFEEYQQDFLMKVGEALASTISIFKMNERNEQLLVEAQKKTDTIQLKEEYHTHKESYYMEKIKSLKKELEELKNQNTQTQIN